MMLLMMMGGVINVVFFILLVCTFTAVCEGNKDIMSTCQVFTASIGDEKTLKCDVSYPNKDCSVMEYKFIDSSDNSVVSSEEFSGDSCMKNSFAYSYPTNKHTTTQFKFFIQTTCGKSTFNVNLEDDVTITCKDVTACIGDNITLSCGVSYQDKDSCVMNYKFINTTSSDNPVIYSEEFKSDSCIQNNSFSYSYTANKSMTKIKFFIQTTSGKKSTAFSVNIAEAVKQDNTDVGGDPNRHENNKSANGTSVQTGIFIASVICGIVITIIIIILLIVRKIRNASRLQRDNDVDVRDNNVSKPLYEETL